MKHLLATAALAATLTPAPAHARFDLFLHGVAGMVSYVWCKEQGYTPRQALACSAGIGAGKEIVDMAGLGRVQFSDFAATAGMGLLLYGIDVMGTRYPETPRQHIHNQDLIQPGP